MALVLQAIDAGFRERGLWELDPEWMVVEVDEV